MFRVRQIELVGVRNLAPDAVIAALRLGPRASVFGDTRLLADRVRGLAGVAEARVVRRLPAVLSVELREVEPAALVVSPRGSGRGLVAVDAAGRPLPFDPARSGLDLPIAASGDSGVVAVLALIQSVDPALFQTITGARTFTRGGVLLEIGPHRVLLGRDAGPEVIRAVVLVSQDLAAKRRAYVELDARFAGQVVGRHRGRARLGAHFAGGGGGVGRRDHGRGRGAGERSSARGVAGTRSRAAARYPAGVRRRPAARHLGPRGDDGHPARGGDVPRDRAVHGRAEPAAQRGAGPLPAGRAGARAARRVLRGADGRRERAGRRPGGGGGRVDGRGDLPRREDPAPRVAQVRGHARHERSGGGVGRDAGGRGAVEGATWHRVSAARGCVGDDQPAVHAQPGGAAGVARAAVAHHSPAGGRDLPAGAARVRAGGVRRWTATGRGRADGRDGTPAGDGGAGARGVRGAGAGRDAGAGDLGARRQCAGAALRGPGGSGAVRGAATRAGRRSQRLDGQERGRRAVVRTAEAVVAGLLLIGHPREP